MANKKTRAPRRAKYLRQKEAMDAQAREAMVTQTALQPVPEKKHGDKTGGEVRQQIQLIQTLQQEIERLREALHAGA